MGNGRIRVLWLAGGTAVMLLLIAVPLWGNLDQPLTAQQSGELFAFEGAHALNENEFLVDLKDFRFQPARLHIAPGTTVVFVNRDTVTHNVVGATAGSLGRAPEPFRSPRFDQGEAWRYTFAEEGTFPILCDVDGHHLAGMTGEIVVSEEAGEVPSEASGPRR